MEDYDGFLRRSTKIEKTKILPLRWIGNICGEISTTHLVEAVHMSDHDDHGFKYKYHAIIWKIFHKPYMKWGTFYQLDIQGLKDDLKGSGWDDYDEDGIAYWEKLTNGESQDS